MRYYQYLWPALRLWNIKRLQALLSTSGIAIGISGFVIVIAMSQGARKELEKITDILGTNTLIVRSTASTPARHELTLDQLVGLKALLPEDIHAIAPVHQSYRNVNAGKVWHKIRILATNKDYRQIYKLSTLEGRFLSDFDVRRRQRVCILGWESAQTLFPSGNSLGNSLRIDNELYKVVGVLAPEQMPNIELTHFQLPELDQVVIVPLTTLSADSPEHTRFEELLLKLRNDNIVSPAAPILKRYFGEQSFRGNSFELVIPFELLHKKMRWQKTLEYLLLGISAIVLVVGIAGMMNVMLISVNARKNEIGLRRAIGATRNNILQQFLTEGLVLAAAGGFSGIAIGWLVASLIHAWFSMAMQFDLYSALAGIGIALAAGALSVTYPALKAASIHPVTALRQS
jgi:putative ABC transport system permease protein